MTTPNRADLEPAHLDVTRLAAALIEVLGETPPWWQVKPHDPADACRAWRRIARDILAALGEPA